MTLDTSNSIPLLVGLIREIAQRIDELVVVVSGLFIPSESHEFRIYKRVNPMKTRLN